MGNSIIVTSTDAVVDSNFPKVTGTTLGDKHLLDVSVPGGISSTTYATIVDEPSSTVTYVGVAEPGTSTASAGWQIKRLTVSGTQLIPAFADGNSDFDNVWDDRASLSYS